MEAQEFKDLIPDYILGKLSTIEDERFSAYLVANPRALDDWQDFGKGINAIEIEPSSEMDMKFYNFLNAEIENESSQSKVKFLKTQKPTRSIYAKVLVPLIAASIVLFLGFFIGQNWNALVEVPDDNYVNNEVEQIKNENNQVRTALVMSLADQSSASKRLQALSEASKLDKATEQVILALFKMLNTDTNVNVRLAAVTSLSKYVDNPKVREGLVMSITIQESPLVQIALADLMVALKEQTSINSMESLLQQPDINAAVKLKLEESIKQII